MNAHSERPIGFSGIIRGDNATPVPLSDFTVSSSDVIRRKPDTPEEQIQRLQERIAELEEGAREAAAKHQDDLAAACDKAYQQGLKDGTVAGESSGKAIAQAALETRLRETEASLNHRIEAIECSLEALFLDWEGRILELSLAISRRIVGEICEEPGVAAAHVARAALKKLGTETHIVVRLHPEDFTSLEREKGLWNRGLRKIELLEDETIERGGVIVETEAGSIDARIPRMTAKIEKLLSDAIAEEKARLGN